METVVQFEVYVSSRESILAHIHKSKQMISNAEIPFNSFLGYEPVSCLINYMYIWTIIDMWLKLLLSSHDPFDQQHQAFP